LVIQLDKDNIRFQWLDSFNEYRATRDEWKQVSAQAVEMFSTFLGTQEPLKSSTQVLSVAQQSNDTDCGVYLLLFARQLVLNTSKPDLTSITSQQVQQYRQQCHQELVAVSASKKRKRNQVEASKSLNEVVSIE